MNEFVVAINEKKIEVALTGNNKATVDGKEYNYNLNNLNNNSYNLLIDNKSYLVTAKKNNSSEFTITILGKVIETKIQTALQEKASSLIKSSKVNHLTSIKSPMPGMILKIKIKVGDEVVQGNSLIILEAMKMENDIRTPVSGKIKEIKINEGQVVEKGVILLVIE